MIASYRDPTKAEVLVLHQVNAPGDPDPDADSYSGPDADSHSGADVDADPLSDAVADSYSGGDPDSHYGAFSSVRSYILKEAT